jgi:LysM repeat protein
MLCWLGGRFVSGVMLVTLASAFVGVPEGSAKDCASQYTVVGGDSWSRVSHLTGIYIKPLAAANGMTRDSVISPGMVLCVPPANATNSPPPDVADPKTGVPATPPQKPSKQSSSSTTAAKPSSVICDLPYVVVRNDSWSAIADRSKKSLRSMLSANGATASTPIFPGDVVCLPTEGISQAPPPEQPRATTTTNPPKPRPPTCAEIVAKYERVLCMDLSDHQALIGSDHELVHTFRATAGYGTVETCTKSVAGTFTIGAKYEFSPRKRLKWGMAFGGGCVQDQIVHAVGLGTLYSEAGTAGCIGLLEGDAKKAYDIMQVGDKVVIVD